jgi:hypothetical protein
MTYIPMQDAQRENIDLQEQQLLVLQKIETHLSLVTDEEIQEDDVNEHS